MKARCFALLATAAVGLLLQRGLAGDGPSAKTAREALQPFNDLIGTWKATVQPSGTKEFWQEEVSWEWQFKEKDAWLTVTFDKGKYYTKGTLRYNPDKGPFVLTLTTVNKEELTFRGDLDAKSKKLTLEAAPDDNKDVQRIVINMLHDNRHLYTVEKKKADRTSFTKLVGFGVTKQGVPFAEGAAMPECVVSGGLGTMTVMYMGKTYYVCCSGCAAEFRADPAKYVREFEEKQAKKKDKK